VFQHSRNIRPVYPTHATGRIIADWEGNNGPTKPDPAWVQTERGFWMTHVLRNDGDSRRKKELLLALLTHCDETLWEPAAEYSMIHSVRLASCTTLAETKRKLRAQAQSNKHTPRMELALARADTLREQMQSLWDQEQYPHVVATGRQLRQHLVNAYAEAQHPRPGEMRGVWEHTGTGIYPGDWAKTCRLLARQGITDIFVNLLSAGTAHYPATTLPRSDVFRVHGDQAAQCVAAAHANGLRVHAWKVCWNINGADAKTVQALKRAGRLQVTDTGDTLRWLCPSNPKNLVHEKDSLKQLVRQYPFDGAHLDYIRYPDSHACFCTTCRRNFEQALGNTVARWPHDAGIGGVHNARFTAWRQEQITRYVRDLSTSLRNIDPDIELSAAVYGKYPSCARSVAQDWVKWMHEGYLDFVCPMNYTPDTARFSGWLAEQRALVGPGGRVYPGIGVTAKESQLDPVDVIDQIQALRDLGASGMVLFDLNRTLAYEILPALRRGIFAPIAP
jgi:uncharacterized lipoprotein YddW (UPF0748 family)